MNSMDVMNYNYENKRKFLTSNNLRIIMMYLVAFVVISKPSFTIITGPILLLLMTLLILTDKFYCVVSLTIIANDSLGTVLMGRGSFYWVLLILLTFRIILKRNTIKVSIKLLINLFIVLLILLQFWIVNEVALRSVFQTFFFVFFLLFSFNEIHKDEAREFFFHIALAIFIIALSSIFFGGVVFLEGYTDRLGISGVGIGDPNFSCLILNTGIAIMLAQNYRNRPMRIGMILVMVIAMVQTVSITGLLCLLVLFLSYYLVAMKLPKTARNVLIGCFLVVTLLQYYNTLPQVSRNSSVDLYIFRIEEKLDALANKDYQAVTTNRSLTTEINLAYFSRQSTWKQLIGGNSIPPEGVRLSHNTYVDILLRFGILGTIAFCGVVIKKMWNNFRKYYKTKENGEAFLLKIVFLIFSSALSIYSGNTFALWYMFLIFL